MSSFTLHAPRQTVVTETLTLFAMFRACRRFSTSWQLPGGIPAPLDLSTRLHTHASRLIKHHSKAHTQPHVMKRSRQTYSAGDHTLYGHLVTDESASGRQTNGNKVRTADRAQKRSLALECVHFR